MNFPVQFLQKFILIVFLPMSFTQCTQNDPAISTTVNAPLSYLALGDSYTIGTGIDSLHNYPHQLADSLENRGFAIDTTAIIAVNGWTTTDLLKGIEAVKPDSTFDMVSLLIGVNNQYQGLEPELYRKEFKMLLEQAIVFAGGDTARLWVISIPNYGVTPFAQSRNPVIIRQQIDIYNEIAETISGEYGVPFINITPISEQAADDTSLLAPDNLHPSAKMYAMWVEEMLPTVTNIILD